MTSPREAGLLADILERVNEVEMRCQEMPGPSIDTKRKQFIGEPDEYELTEQVPTLNEFLELCSTVRDLVKYIQEMNT